MSDITQTSVTLSWSIGNTQHVDHIQVDQRGVDAESASANRRFDASSSSSHNVTRLSPGTTYEFFVQIHSYGNIDKTNTTTITTGTTATRLRCQTIEERSHNSTRPSYPNRTELNSGPRPLQFSSDEMR